MSDNPAIDPGPKAYVAVTVGDEVHRHILVNSVRSQLQWSKSARNHGWDREDQILGPIFLAWWNGKRAGMWEMSWEEFADRDDVFVGEDDAPEGNLEDADDPSPRATSDAS